MRSFREGDKVKFLNQTGGGIISKILSPTTVCVLTEDGFELPTASNELLLISDDRASKIFSQQDAEKQKVAEKSAELTSPGQKEERKTITPQLNRAYPLRKIHVEGKSKEGVYLLFIPRDQQWVITGILDIYLVNYTAYDLSFSLFLRDQDANFEGKDHEQVKSQTRILLESIERDDLNRWLQGIVQILFFKRETKRILQPISHEFKIRGSRFYNEENYKMDYLAGDKGISSQIIHISEAPTFLVSEATSIKEEDKTPEIKKKNWFEGECVLEKHMTSKGIAEVDLHIEELVDDTSKLSNTEMLNIQMRYFERCLNAAIENHLSKFIVIHGVGVGVLKQSIEKELSQYQGVHFFAASMAKYGTGATEILLGASASRLS